ncbi:MAG: tetratricopeptide repeat protein [Chloroflexota bacterium]
MAELDSILAGSEMEDILARVEEARVLRKQDELEESQELLLSMFQEHPDHPLILFEVGGSYDVIGEEELAIPYYRRALVEGIDGDDRQECLVCLGSSLRVIGESEEAVAILQQAVEEFPNRPSARVFLALALLDEGEEVEAVATLLDVVLKTSNDEDIQAYSGALEYYRDELRGELD